MHLPMCPGSVSSMTRSFQQELMHTEKHSTSQHNTQQRDMPRACLARRAWHLAHTGGMQIWDRGAWDGWPLTTWHGGSRTAEVKAPPSRLTSHRRITLAEP